MKPCIQVWTDHASRLMITSMPPYGVMISSKWCQLLMLLLPYTCESFPLLLFLSWRYKYYALL